MRPGQVVRAVLLALALVVAPGALRLLPSHSDLDRVLPDAGTRASTAAATIGPPPTEVAMVPPPATLTGELAPAVPIDPPFASTAAPSSGEVLALVIGIDDYPGRRSDLRAAVADADTIDAALSGFGIPAANRVVLRDGQARRAAVVAAVSALVARGGPESTLVLAYAGHVRKVGPGREALVAADGGLITDEELAVLLAPATAPRMWLLLATCFAGGFTEALAPGRILTGAAGANELAYESPELGASFLVHHLVREGWLQGAAGPSVQAAFAYADERIAQERRERRPVEIDLLGSPLVLGPGDPSTRPGAAPGPPPPAPAPPPSAQPAAAPPPPPPPSEEDEEEERSCTLGVLLCEG